MEILLSIDVFKAIIFIFVLPSLSALLFISLAKSGVFMSGIELDIEKKKLKEEINSWLSKHGVSFAGEIEPDIQWNHIDGPLLHLSTAGLVWITWWDRFLLSIGLVSIDHLDIKYCRKEMK
jgi:hypothetical protein